jgi:hypothetical protein
MGLYRHIEAPPVPLPLLEYHHQDSKPIAALELAGKNLRHWGLIIPFNRKTCKLSGRLVKEFLELLISSSEKPV